MHSQIPVDIVGTGSIFNIELCPFSSLRQHLFWAQCNRNSENKLILLPFFFFPPFCFKNRLLWNPGSVLFLLYFIVGGNEQCVTQIVCTLYWNQRFLLGFHCLIDYTWIKYLSMCSVWQRIVETNKTNYRSIYNCVKFWVSLFLW